MNVYSSVPFYQVQICFTTTAIKIQNYFITIKISLLIPLYSPTHSFSLLSLMPINHKFNLRLHNFVISRILYKWNHTYYQCIITLFIYNSSQSIVNTLLVEVKYKNLISFYIHLPSLIYNIYIKIPSIYLESHQMVLYFLQIFKYNLENLRKVSSSLYIFLLFLLFFLAS